MLLGAEPTKCKATLAISASLAKRTLLAKLLLGKALCNPWSSPAPKLCLCGRVTFVLSQKWAGDHPDGLGTILGIASCVNIVFFKPF